MRRYGSDQEQTLFSEVEWSQVNQRQSQAIASEINSRDGDELLNTSTEDLALYCVQRFKVDTPELHIDQVAVSQRETRIDVSRDRDRIIHDRSKPFYITGTSVDVEVPFSGEAYAFRIQPSPWTTSKPRAEIRGEFVYFSISGTNLEAERVQLEINSVLQEIEQYLGWLRKNVEDFNSQIHNQAKQLIEVRKQKLLADRSLVASLGFKIKERPSAATTFVAPEVRRKLTPKPPRASGKPFQPEPVLHNEDYEHILTVLENMTRVMELSPGAFNKIDEESLRTHFLMHLNGHFEGNASAETFNYEGKTDLLIKSKGKNIFIAECKFWRGERNYIDTIDQILGYLSWRDTKAAILVFSRNKNFSTVLEKLKKATTEHKNCKRLTLDRSDTSWTYLFAHKDDPNREMLITIQAYCVPGHIEPRIRQDTESLQ